MEFQQILKYAFILFIVLVVVYIVYTYFKKPNPLADLHTGYTAPHSDPTSCRPDDGVWGVDGKLASPCCQPPNYDMLDTSYYNCSNFNTSTNPELKACFAETCDFIKKNAGYYDPSWAPMAQCAASLCCHNRKEPHFGKYGSCVSYIGGEHAVEETPDTGPVSGGDWHGYIQ